MDHVSSISDLSGGCYSGGTIINSLTDHGHLFLFSYAIDRKALVSWSNNAKELLGVSDGSIAFDGNLFLRHVHPDDRFILLSDLERALKGEASYRCTYRWIRPDTNEVRWLHCRAALVTRAGNTLFEGIILDLSSEFTGPDARLAGPDSVAPILAAFPTIVFTLDRDLRLLRINRPEDSLPFNFGDPNFNTRHFRIGKPLLPCFSDRDQQLHFEKILHDLLAGKQPEFHTRISVEKTVYNLQLTPILERDIIHGVLGVITDITELVQKEREIADLRKTEGLRLLAAGVAHNFNNVLQSVMGFAAAINSRPTNSELALQSSQAIIDAVTRASELSRQMSVLDETPANLLVPVDLNLATMAALNRVDNLLSSGIRVSMMLGNPPPVSAKQEELTVAIEAILKNAKEALGDKGDLSIKSYQITLQELQIADLRGGNYAKLKITDTGNGMESEALKRCFDPFFTTKDRDHTSGVGLQGTGLGLSHVFATIRSFGGAIVAESELERGTSISLYLPVEQSTRRQEFRSTEHDSAEVMVVDDDIMVLETVGAILREAGFQCIVASDSAAALTLAKAHAQTLRLALVDAVMPGMDSCSLIRKLLRINLDLVVIGFSGATEEYTQPLIEAGASQILRKPIDPRKLQNFIRTTLAENAENQNTSLAHTAAPAI